MTVGYEGLDAWDEPSWPPERPTPRQCSLRLASGPPCTISKRYTRRPVLSDTRRPQTIPVTRRPHFANQHYARPTGARTNRILYSTFYIRKFSSRVPTLHSVMPWHTNLLFCLWPRLPNTGPRTYFNIRFTLFFVSRYETEGTGNVFTMVGET